jgi:tetratricopeptide (TPR) repeat protein
MMSFGRTLAPLLAALAVIGTAGGTTTAVATGADDERVQTYRSFRDLFDNKNFAAALPLAERLVQQTETQYGAEDRQLVNPLANLGTTQLKLGNYAAAETHYLRAIRILELKAAGGADRQLLRPLQGLGSAYTAAKQPEAAIAPLKRALDLSRNLDGLFNANQLELIFPLIEAYVATGRLQEAEKEHGYAFRVAETTYGRNDLRMLGSLDRYARWYEYVGRYGTARVLHDRALATVERAGGANDLRKVTPLRGIARTYRLEYLYGPEQQESSQPTDAFGNALPTFDSSQVGQLQRRGEQSLRFAVSLIEKNEPVNNRLRGETVTELGDWFMVGGATPRALEHYRDAWRSLEQGGDVSLLTQPRQLAYRPSTFSLERSRAAPEEIVVKDVTMRFKVTQEGKVTDIVTTTTDVSEPITRTVISAMRRARYAPRLENGQPVDTNDVTFTERVAIRTKQPPADAPQSAPSSAP